MGNEPVCRSIGIFKAGPHRPKFLAAEGQGDERLALWRFRTAAGRPGLVLETNGDPVFQGESDAGDAAIARLFALALKKKER